MRRKCTDSLIHWKKSSNRKPLILQGLRQTGKTWLLMDFGNKQYEHTLYINLETDQPVTDYLTTPRDAQDALLFLETYADKPLHPSTSLLILDNIQCIPQISTLLTTIATDFPQYHITAIAKGVVNSASYSPYDFDILTLFPLDFEEFLWANAEFALAREIRAHFTNFEPLGKKLHERAMTQFHLYQIIGGMPAAIMEYKKEKKLLMIPDVQQKLLDLFLNDITTLAPKGTAHHCRNSWLSIPAQLGRSNRKFQYTRIAKGATAKVYYEPLQWLIRSGLILPCHEISAETLNQSNHSLAHTSPTNATALSDTSDKQLSIHTLKHAESTVTPTPHLYPIDTGLCSRILQVPACQLLSGEESIANTACTEAFLAQQFTQKGYTLSYWASGNQAEVPFLLSGNNRLIAVDYRTTPHQKCRNLMRLPDSLGIKQKYLISTEDFKIKEHYRILPVYSVFCI